MDIEELARELGEVYRRGADGVWPVEFDEWYADLARLEQAIAEAIPRSAVDRLVQFAVAWNDGSNMLPYRIVRDPASVSGDEIRAWRSSVEETAAHIRSLEQTAGVTLIDLGLDVYDVTAAEACGRFNEGLDVHAQLVTGASIQ